MVHVFVSEAEDRGLPDVPASKTQMSNISSRTGNIMAKLLLDEATHKTKGGPEIRPPLLNNTALNSCYLPS
jgi:hypothetical protein